MDLPRDRALPWDGSVNARDLGGLRGPTGVTVRPGRLIRSGSLHQLTAMGWAQLIEHGVRTVIDLRHSWEIEEASVPLDLRPPEVTFVEQPLEPAGYIEEWSGREDRWKLGTPFYYGEFMTDHAGRVAAAMMAIDEAQPGGVLVHCGAGRDRAGLLIALVLDLIGIDRDQIIADHWLSFAGPEPIEAALGKKVFERSLSLTEHSAALDALFDDHAARSCFPDSRQADEVGLSLARRLTG